MTNVEVSMDRMRKMADNILLFDKKQITEALYWMALGDGSIEKPLRGDCLLTISHSIKNRDYIIWKGLIVGQVLNGSVNPQITKGGFGGDCEMLRLRTQHHPWFTKVWERVYGILGRKSIDPHALALLGPLGLAILYQDDGSYHYSSHAGHNIMIHKLCFSKFELEAFAKTVVDKFGIIFRINECKGKGFGYRLRLRAKDREKFFDLVEPYIVPSMLYKVGRGDALTSGEMI